MATPPNSRADGKSSIEAATEAIAKVNAMLIAKGKLKPSQLNSHPGGKKSGPQSNLMTTEVEINDVPIGCRNMLTRGSTQEEISKMSGAAVATRGRFMTPEERANNPSERALYLSVQASSKEAVDLAVGRINEIIANGIARQGAKMSKFSPAGIRGPAPPRGPQQGYMQEPLPPPGPPQQIVMPAVQNITLYQEKLIIGLEHAPPNFSVKDKVFGPGGSFLQHIQAETGCKVTLRGKGSGFIEHMGAEALEPMHIHLQHVTSDGLQQAKGLATNLIQTVQQEYAAFQQSFVTIPPPNLLPQHPYMIPPPQLVSIANPPPLLPGQPVVSVSMAPPVPMLQPPPQNNYLTPPPAVPRPMMQGQPMQAYAPPASVGQQQVHQFVQSSDPQMLSVPVSQPPPMIVSMSGQQPGQMLISSIGGQPPLQTSTVQQIMQQQLPPHNALQVQQPQQQVPVAQHQQILQQQGIQQTGIQMQQPGLHQQQQMGFQHHGAIQQQAVLQSTMSGQQQILQQPQQQVTSQLTTTLQPGLQQLPTSMQTGMQHFPPGMQPIQQQQLSPHPGQPIQQAPLQQQMAPSGVPAPGSWGQPVSSYQPVATGSQFQFMSAQPFLQQAQTAQSMIMSSAQPHPSVMTTPSYSTPVASTPTSYVYSSGPKEEPKRRFTEIKQEDKVPENLLGYEHGPPHLANLVVQPGQPSSQQQQGHPQVPVSAVQQMVQVTENSLQAQGQQFEPIQQVPAGYSGQVLSPHVNVGAQPPQTEQQRAEMEERLQGGSLSPSPGPKGQFGQQQTTNGDKALMPPPPPPTVTGVKRHSPSLSPQPGPERKKNKGLFDEEEEEVEVPSSIASQVKEFQKYSYNQYSSTPQLYQNQEPNANQTYEHFNVQSSSSPEQNAGIQPPPVQLVPGGQGPAPLPPGEPAVMGGYQPDAGAQFLQYQSYSQPVQQTSSPSVYIVSSQAPPSGYVQTSMAPSYSPYTIQSSQSYIPSQQQQQQPQQAPIQAPSYLQPPPPPPVMEEQRLMPQHDVHSTKDMMGIPGFNASYVQYNRDVKNTVHQPPPPPPPPRSYW